MYNASAYDAAMRGLDLDYQSNLRALNDQVNRQQLGYMTEWTGDEMAARSAVPQGRLQAAQAGFGIGKETPLMQERIGQYRSAMISDRSAGQGGLG